MVIGGGGGGGGEGGFSDFRWFSVVFSDSFKSLNVSSLLNDHLTVPILYFPCHCRYHFLLMCSSNHHTSVAAKNLSPCLEREPSSWLKKTAHPTIFSTASSRYCVQSG